MIVIRNTPYGRGVFTTEPIPEDAIIGTVYGSLVSPNEDPEYEIDMGKFGALSPAPPFRFLNHSCEPNCLLEGGDEENEQPTPVYLRSLWPIPLDDQLTIDYGWTAENAIRCLCGSNHCRGWIVAQEELDLVQKP